MIDPRSPFTKLLPELFPVVAAHLPLYSTSVTVLSLALTNHGLYEIVYPLLYSCMVIRNETDALNVLEKMLVDRKLGHLVRELYIMSELSLPTPEGEPPSDVVTRLQKVVREGLLPYIHTLGIYLLRGWHRKRLDEEDVVFWKELRNNCPRLRGIVISGLDHWQIGGWDQLFQVSEPKGLKHGLTHLVLNFKGQFSDEDGAKRLYKSIHCHSPSLQTLVLRSTDRYHSPSCILILEFPRLKSLTLDGFWVRDTLEAMAFWHRHPSLERLRLPNSHRSDLWFDKRIELGLLPNLRHFQANFVNVLPLAPILQQLVSLSIDQSINAQVPYLLRSAIPSGLPHLKSLEIDQDFSSYPHVLRLEGTTWYESADRTFHEARDLKQASRTFANDYIESIARGAPNLEELALHGYESYSSTKTEFIQHFGEFTHLERLYYRCLNSRLDPNSASFGTNANHATFIDSSRSLAMMCKSLKTITDLSTKTVPYLTSTIHRNQGGDVDEVIVGKGYGTQIGSEDDPFPRNPRPLVGPPS
ncbi:hypothetical protein GALMADRAFT_72339 [Galerina marginata CBS 339.88]|uniref:Uncharacterized protein n=1 Tax=Galerina marginata (strain CBS 339.88) TaxID=685588 RepID=A0A067SUN9_GALM3|nr:hypothetical protein GALMADRAFT_72339 [Galerina marginata CBS 339.88]